ncbi:MAG TPA: adenosylmethionine--8-amino-7-oxononanoate transaminase [Candidatus Dormibacteraeota bacterium]|nr:adenosylmethionine--8-amino-7-oxononanoate transaminase [Candidatus Dormibacteraeota bacterium]
MNSSLRVWHPFTQEAVDPTPLRITKAEGVYIYTADGRRFIDAISSWWVNLHGHCHPAIMSVIAGQTAKIDHVLLAGFTHDGVEELSRSLRKILPRELAHIFFSDDGSTAVEVALKMAVQYWRNSGHPEKQSIVALEHAYHGDTAGAMSVSADSIFNDPFRNFRFPVHRVHSAYCYRCPVGRTRATCNIDCADQLARLLEEKGDGIAAVIVEPLLQGAGGMIVHPREFLERVRGLCTRHNVLLIADEVLTGFGRCGKMFACELAGVAPDLMCLSKGITGGVLPMGATVCTDEIHRAFAGEDRSRAFYHGHSYTGNPFAAAAAVASLQIFKREPVFERISAIAKIHEKRLAAIANHPAVGDVRSIGTAAAIELRADDPGYSSRLRPKLYEFFLDAGILLRPLGNVVYVLPPYVITADELHYVHDRIAASLDHCEEWSAAAFTARTA